LAANLISGDPNVIVLTSQWSRKASRGASGLRRGQSAQRDQQAEEICRALVAATTPDGRPVLRRPLTAFERKQLARRAAELASALAPLRASFERIAAVLAATPADQMARPSAEALFADKPSLTSDISQAPSRDGEA
jgi:hypothetical protein